VKEGGVHTQLLSASWAENNIITESTRESGHLHLYNLDTEVHSGELLLETTRTFITNLNLLDTYIILTVLVKRRQRCLLQTERR
jgi:hypothetical protein